MFKQADLSPCQRVGVSVKVHLASKVWFAEGIFEVQADVWSGRGLADGCSKRVGSLRRHEKVELGRVCDRQVAQSCLTRPSEVHCFSCTRWTAAKCQRR